MAFHLQQNCVLVRVSPIPKGTATPNPANYQPISLLSMLSKLLETHVRKLMFYCIIFRCTVLSLIASGASPRGNQPPELFLLPQTSGTSGLTRASRYVQYSSITVRPLTLFPIGYFWLNYNQLMYIPTF